MAQSQRTRSVPDDSSGSAVPRLSAKEFLRQYIRSQTGIMEGMVQMLLRGEIQIDEAGADEVIDRIMQKWMASDDPDFKLQMKAQAAMFLDELLEAYYAARNGTQDDLSDEAPQVASVPGAAPGYLDVTIEVIKTIRSIWGKN